jgi:hypothetical protein
MVQPSFGSAAGWSTSCNDGKGRTTLDHVEAESTKPDEQAVARLREIFSG